MVILKEPTLYHFFVFDTFVNRDIYYFRVLRNDIIAVPSRQKRGRGGRAYIRQSCKKLTCLYPTTSPNFSSSLLLLTIITARRLSFLSCSRVFSANFSLKTMMMRKDAMTICAGIKQNVHNKHERLSYQLLRINLAF